VKKTHRSAFDDFLHDYTWTLVTINYKTFYSQAVVTV